MSLQSVRSAVLLGALLIGAGTFPSSLSAQQGANDGRDGLSGQVPTILMSAWVATASPASTVGPRLAPAGFTRALADSTPTLSPPNDDSRMGAGKNVAMMGVGVAAVGVGILIGGDGGNILALTGGVVGLVGLYRYLR